MNKLWILSILATLAAASAEYPATEIYAGPLAAPKIATAAERSYQTRIREGIAKGWGVRLGGWEGRRPAPNFAGHMVVIQWMCGSPCTMMALVDGRTGTVYPSPFARELRNEFVLPLVREKEQMARPVNPQFRVDSRVMEIDASDSPDLVYRYRFLWEGMRWRLLGKVVLRGVAR